MYVPRNWPTRRPRRNPHEIPDSRHRTPPNQQNTGAGFRTEASANGSAFSGFGFFGNYTSRIDGPGKVFDFSNVSDMTIDDIWAEHVVCLFWGTNVDNSTIKNSRIRQPQRAGDRQRLRGPDLPPHLARRRPRRLRRRRQHLPQHPHR
ncbi:hypothetical protein [Actinomadura geliboluensis]|uniref:hypothetical protein n=1 Tax=Actinomadura geliboluensis TaxID=882440 RepID=UPI003712E2FC